MADIESIKNRIRKMLRLAADDGAAEGEIQTALEGAQYLLARHQLDQDEVMAEGQEQPADLRSPEEIARDCEYGRTASFSTIGRAPQWQDWLASAVAKFLGTVQTYKAPDSRYTKPTGIVANDGKPVTSWVFYGPCDDCEFARDLHQELMLACAATAKLKFGGGIVKGPARDYCDGFAMGLYRKIEESQKAMETDPLRISSATAPQSTALTVIDLKRSGEIIVAKREQASDWLQQSTGIKLRTRSTKSRWVRDTGAYNAGRADGASQTLTGRAKRIGSN